MYGGRSNAHPPPGALHSAPGALHSAPARSHSLLSWLSHASPRITYGRFDRLPPAALAGCGSSTSTSTVALIPYRYLYTPPDCPDAGATPNSSSPNLALVTAPNPTSRNRRARAANACRNGSGTPCPYGAERPRWPAEQARWRPLKNVRTVSAPTREGRWPAGATCAPQHCRTLGWSAAPSARHEPYSADSPTR